MFFLVNGFGLIATASFCGLAYARGYEPWISLAGCGIFLLMIAMPFVIEYGILSQGFREIEERIRKLFGLAEEVEAEIIGPDGRAIRQAPVRKRKTYRKLLILITAFSCLIVLGDVLNYHFNPPDNDLNRDVISNF